MLLTFSVSVCVCVCLVDPDQYLTESAKQVFQEARTVGYDIPGDASAGQPNVVWASRRSQDGRIISYLGKFYT